MADAWQAGAGVVTLPSGRLVRGRSLRAATQPAGPQPDFGLYLSGRRPAAVPWPHDWLRWPDFLLPSDPQAARRALLDVWSRSAGERVEIACSGGRGRTGTALACLAVLDGVAPTQAVLWTRQHYRPRAVETAWQRRFVARFEPQGCPGPGASARRAVRPDVPRAVPPPEVGGGGG